MSVGNNVMSLLVCILSCLPENLKGQITLYVDHRQLDLVLREMMVADVFPEWFSSAFYYDPLHGFLGGLRDALSLAVFCELVEYGGTDFDYHIKIGPRIRKLLLERISVPEASVAVWAKDLEDRLLALERFAAS